ncbi:hypothetical protein SPHINGOT1_60011 [Sphingomonas sp. T1]|nr:hypothetical protein SPHINGOT1_60011 [Sphingomonas sp. T1]
MPGAGLAVPNSSVILTNVRTQSYGTCRLWLWVPTFVGMTGGGWTSCASHSGLRRWAVGHWVPTAVRAALSPRGVLRRRVSGQVRFEHAVEMHDDELHLGIVDRALRCSTPGLFGAGIVGEYADKFDLAEVVEIQGARVADAAAEYEMKLAHALLSLEWGLQTP